MSFFLALLLSASLLAPDQADKQHARDILSQLISIDTTDSSGSVTRAARAIAERFLAAGFPPSDVQVLELAPRQGNVVARIRGAGAGRPILFIGHLDVVEAPREGWHSDPFQLAEREGFFYGRGTIDMKGEVALLVANFTRLRREGFRPQRDLILALTCGEERAGHNGVGWLIANHRDLIDAEYAVNGDSGGGQFKHGKRLLFAVQAAEKSYATFHLRATNPGGHSSLPVRDNAI